MAYVDHRLGDFLALVGERTPARDAITALLLAEGAIAPRRTAQTGHRVLFVTATE